MDKRNILMNRKTPIVLSGIAVAGTIATAVLSSIATLKAKKRIEKEKYKQTPIEIFRLSWKYYILPVSVCTSTIACIIGSNAVGQRQRAALIGAYGLLNTAYQSYQDKVKEQFGEEVHNRIKSEIVAEKAKDIHIVAPTLTHCGCLDFTGVEETPVLFYDSFSDRYFESTVSKVLQAEYHLNRNFALGAIPALNDFYDFLGLEHTPNGDSVGWTNVNGEYYWIDFFHNHAWLTEEEDLECWIIDADQQPTADYLDDL